MLKKVREEVDGLKAETMAKLPSSGSITPNNATTPVVTAPDNPDLVMLRKDVEENKAQLVKMRENFQSVLKKVKEEFVALEAKTTSAEVSAGTPSGIKVDKTADFSDFETFKAASIASEADMRKKIDEASSSVTKLKDSIQNILKKIKEEFTALDAKVTASL